MTQNDPTGGRKRPNAAAPERWRLGMRGGHNAATVFRVDDSRSPHDEEAICAVYGIALHETVAEAERTPRNAEGLRRGRLIAAAPELLAALRALCETVVSLGGHKTEALEAARAVLRRAEGAEAQP